MFLWYNYDLGWKKCFPFVRSFLFIYISLAHAWTREQNCQTAVGRRIAARIAECCANTNNNDNKLNEDKKKINRNT